MKVVENNKRRKLRVKGYFIVLISVFVILIVSWIISTVNLPETNVLYHQSSGKTEITLSSAIYFCTHQISSLNIKDTVLISIILPKLRIKEILSFKGTIIARSESDKLICYDVKIIEPSILKHRINEDKDSDSLKTVFKIIKVQKFK